MRQRKRRHVLLILIAIASPVVTATPAPADEPCVWVHYNLPLLGSGGHSPCSPINRPPGWTAELSPSDRRSVGSHYVEAGASVPVPEG